jgi:hypothetical protein
MSQRSGAKFQRQRVSKVSCRLARHLFADLPPEVFDGFNEGLAQVLTRLRAQLAGKEHPEAGL